MHDSERRHAEKDAALAAKGQQLAALQAKPDASRASVERERDAQNGNLLPSIASSEEEAPREEGCSLRCVCV